MKNKMKWVMVLALVCFGSIMLYADCRNCGARFTKTFPCNKCGEWGCENCMNKVLLADEYYHKRCKNPNTEFAKKRKAAAGKKKERIAEIVAINKQHHELQVQVDAQAAQLADYLIAAAQKNIPVQDQVKVMTQLTGKLNAAKYWAVLAANASLPVIQYYWPAGDSEEQYLQAKKVMEAPAPQSYSNADFGTIDPKQWDRFANNDDWRLLRDSKKDKLSGIRIAKKKGPLAFALGRSKKDNSIRGVDNTERILNACAIKGNVENLKYFEAQCGGFNDKDRLNFILAILKEYVMERDKNNFVQKRLDEIDKRIKVAEDKYEEADLQKKKQEFLKKNPLSTYKPSPEMITYLLKPYQGAYQDFRKTCSEELTRFINTYYGCGDSLDKNGRMIYGYDKDMKYANQLFDEMLAGVDQTSIPMLVTAKARTENLRRMQGKAKADAAARVNAAKEKAAAEAKAKAEAAEKSIEGQVDKALNKVFNLF
ncbi:MAG: hypothetical protein J6S98_00400 [Lentisphaeria bacterium]|nr:hypothetical protein [Lentisphaeria bacterium]